MIKDMWCEFKWRTNIRLFWLTECVRHLAYNSYQQNRSEKAQCRYIKVAKIICEIRYKILANQRSILYELTG